MDDCLPAFPSMWRSQKADGGGMSLRDYFAAKAMQAMLVDAARAKWKGEEICAAAYAVADAMLLERAK